MPNQRVLVIGVGSIGERHLRCFGRTGRADISICEINDTLRDTIAERYSIANAHADFEEALATQPDVAVICSPAHLHIPMAMKLADAGIHFLCEKPLSASLDGVLELIANVNRQNITAAVAYVYRCTPLSRALHETLHSGRFGAPLNVAFQVGQHFPFYRPAYREIYYTDRQKGGGAIQDALTHVINLSEWLVGPVDRLVADAEHLALEGVTVEDTVHVLTRQGPILGCYALNQHQMANETCATIVCEQATLRAEYHRQRWMWQDRPDGEWTIETMAPVERDDHFVAQANMFLDAVEQQGDVACSLEAGLQTLRVNLAALQSVEHSGWESLL